LKKGPTDGLGGSKKIPKQGQPGKGNQKGNPYINAGKSRKDVVNKKRVKKEKKREVEPELISKQAFIIRVAMGT